MKTPTQMIESQATSWLIEENGYWVQQFPCAMIDVMIQEEQDHDQ